MRKWTRYLPDIALHLNIGFATLDTRILCESYESLTVDVVRLYWRVWKWSGDFRLYWRKLHNYNG